MKGLLALAGVIDAISKALGRICIMLVLICALICAGNALSSWFFSWTNNGWLEIQWYLFGVIVLVGASETLRQNGHVRVDLVYGMVSDRARLWIDIFGILFFLLPTCIYFTWLCWPFFYNSYLIGEQAENSGGLIRWPIKLVLVLGFGLLVLQGVSELIKRLAALAGKVTVDTSYEKPLQ